VTVLVQGKNGGLLRIRISTDEVQTDAAENEEEGKSGENDTQAGQGQHQRRLDDEEAADQRDRLEHIDATRKSLSVYMRAN
jgi:hypothetical protein